MRKCLNGAYIYIIYSFRRVWRGVNPCGSVVASDKSSICLSCLDVELGHVDDGLGALGAQGVVPEGNHERGRQNGRRLPSSLLDLPELDEFEILMSFESCS